MKYIKAKGDMYDRLHIMENINVNCNFVTEKTTV